MHILFLTDNFPPEVNAPATRTYEHAIRWIEEGCKVTVITCAPNFPEGKVFSGYKNKWYQYQVMDDINVVRVKTFITANNGFLLRTVDYLSFMITGFIAGLFQKKPDVIIATSPQFFTACMGWMLSVFRNRPFVFELRDLWPASIIAVGAMKNSLLITWLEKLELFLYKKADAIISVTNSFKDELISRGINGNKIFVILNGVDHNNYQPTSIKDSILSEKYNLKDKFVVGYLGTHGLAHGLDVILDAAEKLKQYPNIFFMLVGSGAAKSDLVMNAKKRNLKNILFIDSQPKELMKRYYSLCNISLIHLKNNPLFASVIPSKLFESMAMGLPIIMALPKGEATKLVNHHKCGVIISPENSLLLANSVLELQSNNEQLNQYKESAINASLLFSRDVKAREMLNVLNNFVKRNS